MLSLCEYPDLLDKPETANLFPADVIERARLIVSKTGGLGTHGLLFPRLLRYDTLLAYCVGGCFYSRLRLMWVSGAYSHSAGVPHFRENVARFIQERYDLRL